jgi:hypothetical protein
MQETAQKVPIRPGKLVNSKIEEIQKEKTTLRENVRKIIRDHGLPESK